MDEEKLTTKQADQVIAGIDEWWNDRRRSYAMSTEEHNRELAQVEDLKKKIRGMIADEGEAEGTEI